MTNLAIKAFGGLLFLMIVMAAALFIATWTFDYWQAWIFLALFLVAVAAITVYLMKKDPGLLQRRVKAGPANENEKSQKVIQSLMQVAFILVLVIPAIDHRFAWSGVPTVVVLLGDVLVVLGLLIVFFVFKENTFTSATIETAAEQKVVSTGPYSMVRHPMYMGALIMLLGVPPALGSWWGLLTIIPMVSGIIFRLLDEEKFLEKNLPGYSGYKNKVRYRLVPFVW